MHARTHARTHVHARAHTHTHTHTHARTRTHARTQTHVHTYVHAHFCHLSTHIPYSAFYLVFSIIFASFMSKQDNKIKKNNGFINLIPSRENIKLYLSQYSQQNTSKTLSCDRLAVPHTHTLTHRYTLINTGTHAHTEIYTCTDTRFLSKYLSKNSTFSKYCVWSQTTH